MAKARQGIRVGGRAGTRSLPSLFRTELLLPLLGRQGLRLRIGWCGCTPRIVQDPRQGRKGPGGLREPRRQHCQPGEAPPARAGCLPHICQPPRGRSTNGPAEGLGPSPPLWLQGRGRFLEPSLGPAFCIKKKIFFITMSNSPRFSVTHTHLFIPSIQHTLINHLFCAKHSAP